MDNQQNNQNQNQNQNNQIPINQEPPISESQLPPTDETQLPPLQPEPEIQYESQTPQSEVKSESIDNAAAKYQEILNEYAASQKKVELENNSEELPSQPDLEPFEPETELQPQAETEPQIQYDTPIETPVYDIPNNEPVESNYSGDYAKSVPQNSLFKTIFIIVLIINIFIFSVAALIFYKTNQNKNNSNLPTISPTPVSSVTCLLNDITYKVGESFPSADGCNTCSCAETGDVICTEKACDITSDSESVTIIPTKAATKSATTAPTKTTTSSAKKNTTPITK